ALVVGSGTSLWMTLRVAGAEVGRLAILLAGDRRAEEAGITMLLDTVCAELDVVLSGVHLAAQKQRLTVEVEELLTDAVFDRGVDRAVRAIYREIGLVDFALVYRDEIERGRYHYRTYHRGELRHGSAGTRDAVLDAAIADSGEALFDPDSRQLRAALGLPDGVELVLSTGMTSARRLGKVVCRADAQGFSAYALDVVQLMGEAMSQRLVDFNRERRHLAQFFAPPVIAELLNDPDYHDHYLTPREDTVAVLYADINSFTKLSEQVLVSPAAIAEFVDRWSTGAVDLLWDHGGVFDKMVGDCVIGLFGPPFFRDAPADRALAALKAAGAIASFTAAMEREAAYQAIPRSGVVPGLGVAIGINLCPMAVGFMGPNHDYTGFSSGMNATARLQSLAGYRQTYAMESLCEALREVDDGFVRSVRLGEVRETAVKNVKLPLRYREVAFPAPVPFSEAPP
ncbi:MAG TPA: adenylate/guanylate cyclase domain-containing protein, partial [Polyangiaceae bacterium]|nr:adenylate/guanylate cyclase domain-containing protein [Polyangiaceae bacterium]